MDTAGSVSILVRRFMYATAAAFGLMGLLLFLAPGWSAQRFAWQISPMVAMTMGGWYLGSAVMAGLVGYHGRWQVMRGPAFYVALFGVSEAVVLIAHNAKLKLDALLAWPYVGMLALAIIASLLAGREWLRRRPGAADEGPPIPRWVRAVMALFILGVAFLAYVALRGSSTGLYGTIFPEPLSLFTLQSFGAFYFSLSVSILAVLGAKRVDPITTHVQGGFVMIALITIAAFVHFSSFNVSLYPRQSLYIGVYLLAAAIALLYLWDARSRRRAQRDG